MIASRPEQPLSNAKRGSEEKIPEQLSLAAAGTQSIEKNPDMVYISSNGSVSNERPHNPLFHNKIIDKVHGLPPQWKAASVVFLAFCGQRWLNPNPLAGGNVPAAALGPHQHWKRITSDDFFVRSMSEHLGSYFVRRYTESDNMEIVMERVDFGGPDGHVLEKSSWDSVESIRGTRCSTTRSAITAYFCGADVAGNQDAALGKQGKMHNVGVNSLADFLSCRHATGQRKDWMGKVDEDGSPHAHLSLADLHAKLKQVGRLMKISGWDYRANRDYFELFGVDKEKEAMKAGKPPVRLTWHSKQRLEAFYWDEACEYPVPDDKVSAKVYPGEDGDVGGGYDECFVGLGRNMLKELLGNSAIGSLDLGDETLVDVVTANLGVEDDEGASIATEVYGLDAKKTDGDEKLRTTI